ncbi:MAG: hypothetical protein ABII71_00970 [Candidatus Micrarchaeota archaeon]
MRQRRRETSRATKVLVGLMTATSFTLAGLAAWQLGPDMPNCNGAPSSDSTHDSPTGPSGSYRRAVIGGSLGRPIRSKRGEILRLMPGSPKSAVVSVTVATKGDGSAEISSATAKTGKGGLGRTDITETIREFVPLRNVKFPPGKSRIERYEIEISR